MKQIRGIWLPEDDHHFQDHLEKGPEYRSKGTYQFKKIIGAMEHVHNFGVALDIGAHIGLWSRYLIDHFKVVVAFEPVPEHLECYKANLAKQTRLSPEHRIILHPIALGNANTTIKIETTAHNSGNAHVTEVLALNGLEVSMRKLDEMFLFDKQIDFIKIDVEGFELEVLKGGEQLIKTNKPTMCVEHKGGAERYGYKNEAAIDLLKSWGARVVWTRSGDSCLVWS